MGGELTEVTAKTTNIVLEGAIFEPKAIRHAARDQNLHSEASTRFERGVNVEDTFTALDHAAALIAEIAGGDVTEGRVVAQDFDYEAPVVKVTTAHVNHVLNGKSRMLKSQLSLIICSLTMSWTTVNSRWLYQLVVGTSRLKLI